MKKIGIALFIIFSLFPIYNICAQDNIENSVPANESSISKIEKLVEENIPDFIKKPMASAIDRIEEFRKNIGALLENEKEKAKTEIETANGDKILFKTVKYAKLYLFTFSSAILNNEVAFYVISIVFLFFIVRRIWRLVF